MIVGRIGENLWLDKEKKQQEIFFNMCSNPHTHNQYTYVYTKKRFIFQQGKITRNIYNLSGEQTVLSFLFYYINPFQYIYIYIHLYVYRSNTHLNKRSSVLLDFSITSKALTSPNATTYKTGMNSETQKKHFKSFFSTGKTLLQIPVIVVTFHFFTSSLHIQFGYCSLPSIKHVGTIFTCNFAGFSVFFRFSYRLVPFFPKSENWFFTQQKNFRFLNSNYFF